LSDARKRKRDRPRRPARLRKKPADADDETPSPAADPLQAFVARIQPIADVFTDGLYVLDVDGRFVFVNQVIEARSGLPLDDWRRRTYLDVILPEDRDRTRANFRVVLAGGEPPPYEVRYAAADGRTRAVEIATRPVSHEGRVVGLLGVSRDITDRKRAAEALRQSEANYRAIFNAVNDAIFVHDVETGEVVDVNRRAVEAYGYGPDELDALNAAFRQRSDPPYTFADQWRWLRRAADEGPQVFEWLARDRHGREFWTEVSLRRAVIGGTDRLMAVLRDISDRKQAEEAHRRSEEEYRLLFEQSVDGIVISVGREIVRANDALAAALRTTADALIGRDLLEFVHPDDRDVAAERIARLMAGEGASRLPRRYRALRVDGTPLIVELNARCILWKGEAVLQSIVRDVTEQVRMEEQLQQAMKMEAVGQLAGGIAHDFNNLMTGILCHAGLLKSEAADPGAVRETADLIEGAARRATELTSRLLGFARRGKQRDVPVDLAATVETGVRLLSRSLTPPRRIRTDFRHSPAYVRGDPVQMEQVVLNLAMNARDAMPDGGDITFALDHRDVAEDHDRRPPHACPGRYVVLSVTDTGCGIPANLHDRVFEPFFTTKPQGKGTGMGLAMVYGIVRNHGGWIDIESAPNSGATFHVFLPAIDPPAEPPPAAAAPAPRRHDAVAAIPAGGRVLVVDDEAIVRDVLRRMLTRRGYEVITAAGGAEAIACFRDAADKVDLAIIDLRMPGMDGRTCFQALKTIQPGLRAILATGGGPEIKVQDLLDDGAVMLIQKPFEADQLDEAIRKALAP